MITKFKEPIKTKTSQIDELYDGKYVAFQGTDEMFGMDICYIVATGDKTDEDYYALEDYTDELIKETGIPSGVRVGNKNRGEDNLYVVFRDVQ